MSDDQKRLSPFRSLGSRLKQLRQKNQESVAEVSGAVEIEAGVLASYESGEARPSEDILMLLMNHFDVADNEASNIWKLAGYDRQKSFSAGNIDEAPAIQNFIVMPLESRVAYTDQVIVSANEAGLVINFMQSEGLNGQPQTVSRVGMSREQAQKVLDNLQTALKPAELKLLSHSLPNQKKSDKK